MITAKNALKTAICAMALALLFAGWALAEDGGEPQGVITQVYPAGWGHVEFLPEYGEYVAVAGDGHYFDHWRYVGDPASLPEDPASPEELGVLQTRNANAFFWESGVYTAVFRDEGTSHSVTLSSNENGQAAFTSVRSSDPSSVPQGDLCRIMLTYGGDMNIEYLLMEQDGEMEIVYPDDEHSFAFTMPDHDANGGTGEVNPMTCLPGEEVCLYDFGLIRPDATFSGWSLDPQGQGQVYTDGASVTLYEDATFYAVWNEFSAWEDMRCSLALDTYSLYCFSCDAVLTAEDEPLIVPSGSVYIINLNGCTIDASAMEDYAIQVQEGGELRIEDDSRPVNGAAVSNSYYGYNTGTSLGGIRNLRRGILNEGIVDMTRAALSSSSESGATLVNQGTASLGSMIIQGCSGRGIVNMGQMTLNQSVIADCQTGVENGGSLGLNNCLITRCQNAGLINRDEGAVTFGATQTDLPVNANGTALALRAGDNVIDHCGTGVINRGYMETASQTQISDNTQGISNSGALILSRVSLMRNTGGEAGGLVNAESGQVAMTDVAIRGNSGSVAGGILNRGFLTTDGADITDNHGNQAGGVCSSGTLEANDLRVVSNTAAAGGVGGVRIDGGSAAFTLGEANYVLGNTAGGVSSNVYLPEGATLSMPDQELYEEDYVSFTCQDAGDGRAITRDLTDPHWALCHFYSDDPAYVIRRNDEGDMALFLTGEEDHVVTFWSDDEMVGRYTVAHGDELPNLTLQKENMEFGGWMMADGHWCDVDQNGVQSDMDLYAAWFELEAQDVADWNSLVRFFWNGGSLRLNQTIRAQVTDQSLVVPSGVTVRLDLNGNRLEADELPCATIVVEEGGELILTDGGQRGYIGCGGVDSTVRVRGVFRLLSGTVDGFGDMASVYVEPGGQFYLSGGTVKASGAPACGAVYNGGLMEFANGSIVDSWARDLGGGITNDGALTMTGGIIQNNHAAGAGGVYNRGAFTLIGGILSDNGTGSALNQAGGVTNEGTFVMAGGEIIGSEGTLAGGVLQRAGEMTLSGGTIFDNRSIGGPGGMAVTGGVLRLSGGRVISNYTSGDCPGVDVSGGELILSGAPMILDNQNDFGAMNLRLSSPAVIGGDLMDGLCLGITYSGNGPFTSGLSAREGWQGFVSDNPAYRVCLNDGEAALTPAEPAALFHMPNGNDVILTFQPDELLEPLPLDEVLYHLLYWYTDSEDEPFDFTQIITQWTEFYPRYLPIYRVTLTAREDSNDMVEYSVIGGDLFRLPDCPFTAPTGMEFVEWKQKRTDETLAAGDEYTVDERTAFCAVWAPRTYSAAVAPEIPHGAVTLDRDAFTLDDIITITAAPDEGYLCESIIVTQGDVTQVFPWPRNDSVQYIPQADGDIVVNASFWLIPADYTVVFDPGEGCEPMEPVTVYSGTPVARPDFIPERRGATFLGWSRDGETLYDFDAPVTQSMTLTALWDEAESYSIEVESAPHAACALTVRTTLYGETVEIDVTHDPAAYPGEQVIVTVTCDPGYSLSGLTASLVDGAPVAMENNAFTMPEGDVTVRFQVEAMGDYQIVPVTAGDGQGRITVKTRANEGEAVPFAVQCAEGCYLEDVWIEYGEVHTSLMGQTQFVMPASDVTLTALFRDYQVTVADMEHGCVTPSAAHAPAGAQVALTVTPEEGYILETLTVTDGSGEVIEITDGSFTMPASDVTISAAFRLDGLFFVTFVSGAEDIAVPTQSVWHDEYAAEPHVEREGYLLLGWYMDGSDTPFGFETTPVTADITLTARWEKLCRVTFQYNDTVYSTQYVRSGECAAPPEGLEMENMTFQRWYFINAQYEKQTFIAADPVTGDMDVMAEWALNVTTWAALSEACGQGGNVILQGDITRSEGDETITMGKSVTVNLNGHTLHNGGQNLRMFYIYHGIFRIEDRAGGGVITGSTGTTIMASGSGSAVYWEGGTLRDNHVTGDGVIYISSDAQFRLYDGALENNTVTGQGGAIYMAGGTLTVMGGRISGNSAVDGGAVYARTGRFNLLDGAISGNTASNTGGGVYIGRGYTGVMVGGAISGNTARCGGGIYIAGGNASYSFNAFSLSGGVITGNHATESCGGIYCGPKALSVHGDPRVIGNTAGDYASNVVVYASSDPIVVTDPLTDALIGVSPTHSPLIGTPKVITSGLPGMGDLSHFFSDRGGSWILDLNESGEAVIRLDTVWVSFDTQGGSSVEAQEILRTRFAVRPEDPARDGWRFVDWYADGEQEPFDFDNTPIQEDMTLTARWQKVHTVTFVTGTDEVTVEPQIVPDGETAEGSEPEREGYTFLGWYLDGSDTPFDFENTPVTGDTTLTAHWEKLCLVTFRHNDTVYAAQYVRSGECVAPPEGLEREGMTLQRWVYYDSQSKEHTFTASIPVTGDMVVMAEWARNVTSWAELLDVTTNRAGNVLLLNDITRGEGEAAVNPSLGMGSIINLNGHTISNGGQSSLMFIINRSCTFGFRDWAGGGMITGSTGTVIYVSGKNTIVDWDGGSLCGNHVGGDGVVTVEGGGQFYVHSGAIENNTVTGSGGAIYVDGGVVTIAGGRISGNTAGGNGGAIQIESGRFSMSGGVISGNTAGNVGGGVCIERGQTGNMIGGTISGNTAIMGGGVYVAAGSASANAFYMSGGSVTGNTATQSGGGIYSGPYGLSVAWYPQITGNTAAGQTGNVALCSSEYPIVVTNTMTDALIGVTLPDEPRIGAPVVITSGLSGKGNQTHFFSDNDALILDLNGSGEAQIRLDTVFVAFDAKGGDPVESQEILRGDLAARPEDPAREGWRFAGWFLDEAQDPFDFETTPVEEDITLTAHWQKLHTVTFVTGVDDLIVEPQIIPDGETATDPCLTREGWLLEGWFLDDEEEPFDFSASIAGDITLTARWEKLISVILVDGEEMTYHYSRSGETLSLATRQRDGYTFLCWLYQGEPFDLDTPVTQDMILTAQWAKNAATWAELAQALEDGGDILVTGDLLRGEEDPAAVLPAGLTARVDLDGHTLNAGGRTGLEVGEGAALTLTGGTLTAVQGQALLVGGQAELDHISVTGCSTDGSLIRVPTGGALRLTDSTVENNTVSASGAVRVDGGRLEVSGLTRVTGNATSDGTPVNLLLASGARIHLADTLSPDALLAVTAEPMPVWGELLPITSGLSGIGGQRFVSDSPDCAVTVDEATGEAALSLLTPEFGQADFTLPAAMTEVEESAFEGIAAQTVYVPDGCRIIGDYAFRASAVTRIRLPAQCQLGEGVFDDCAEVLIFGVPGSPAEAYAQAHTNCTFIPEAGQ